MTGIRDGCANNGGKRLATVITAGKRLKSVTNAHIMAGKLLETVSEAHITAGERLEYVTDAHIMAGK